MVERGDPAVAVLAGAQHGVVSRGQLAAAGLGRGAIEHRLRRGRLHLAYRGVYLVGHPAAPRAAWAAAALLACGGGAVPSHVTAARGAVPSHATAARRAVLSHGTAARRWGLLDGESSAIDVTVAGGHRPATDRRPARANPPPRHPPAARPALRAHRTGRLDDRDVAVRDGLPLTSPARTLLDLSATAPERELRRAVDEALLRRLVGAEEMSSMLARWPRRPGVGALRGLLARGDEPSLTRSEAERLLLDLVRAAGLPAPETNVRVARYEVDALWRERGVVVEVDGFAFHSSRAAFERDRARDAELQALGLRVLRVTWRALRVERERVAAQLAQLLASPPR